MHTLAKDQSDAPCGKHYNTRTRHKGRLGCAASRIHLLFSISKDMFHPTLSSHHCNPEPNRSLVWHVCTTFFENYVCTTFFENYVCTT
ncbi:hypothetical protein Hanom_Chr05g00466051 [Helianthus anomalus]